MNLLNEVEEEIIAIRFSPYEDEVIILWRINL